MNPLISHRGIVAALDKINVDTDQIIPKQFLKRVERSGFGQFLFYNWRVQENGEQNPQFVLNQPRYQGASILLARQNFGCGSSREHAPWALLDYGFQVIIAPSFADIFFNNCFKTGVLPIVLPAAAMQNLFERAEQTGYALTVDLKGQEILDDSGLRLRFEVDAYRRYLLLEGLDDIAVTLQMADAITAYEQTTCR